MNVLSEARKQRVVYGSQCVVLTRQCCNLRYDPSMCLVFTDESILSTDRSDAQIRSVSSGGVSEVPLYVVCRRRWKEGAGTLSGVYLSL